MNRNTGSLIAAPPNPMPGRRRFRPSRSDVELLALDLPRTLHDEAEAGRDVFPEQVVDHSIGLQLVGDADPERLAPARIERGGLEILRRHLSQTLEPGDVR